MPQNTAIAILDGAATPVSHTFNPVSVVGDLATFKERVTGVPVGMPTLTWSLRAPTKTSATYKVSGKLTQPYVVTVVDSSGKSVTSVDYTNLGSIELVFSERSNKQQRTDLRVLLSNVLKSVAVISVVDDLENFW